ncbi:MAG: hypothetical protein QM778_26420 [Myxococcales bacterium]
MPRPHQVALALAVEMVALLVVGCDGKQLRLGAGRPTAESDAGALAVPEFGEPRLLELAEDTDLDDDDPSLSADGLSLFFNRHGEGTAREDIWFATRTRLEDPWTTPEAVSELNSEHRETGLALSGDGLSLWFSSDRPGGAGGLDVYVARRQTRDAAWGSPERVSTLSSPGDDLISAVDRDALMAYLARRAGEDEDYALYAAERAHPADDWGEPQPLSELDRDGAETDAFPAADALHLLYTDDEDLVLAGRDAPGAPFQFLKELSELNSDADDRDAWLSDDQSYIVFSSDRSGKYRLYTAQRLLETAR